LNCSRKFFPLLLLQALLWVWLPVAVYAQGPTDETDTIAWRELKTEHFVIVYAERVEGLALTECDCGVEEAEFYAGFADEAYQDLVVIFGKELETPINLRLFPTEESYYEVNPVAEFITGVIAHAMNNREEIAIALPRTRPLTEEEIINNVRHELTHFFASLLSDGKLTTGFQEGIAQYVEKPTIRAGYDPTLLKLAFEQDRLLTWDELDKSERVFADPQVAYPQALSIASFLIDQYGFPTFLKFIESNAVEPGYRSALKTTYNKSAEELETEWLAYLPEYFDGRWQINVIYAYDLSRMVNLVEYGAYTDAEVELVEIIQLLETTDQTDVLAEAELLLAKAHQGQAAGKMADEARQALQAHDYATVISKANESIATYEEIGYRDRIPEIQVYIQRAELGQSALDQLQQGEQLLESFRFLEAETQIYEATVLLQALDHRVAAQRGVELLQASTQRQNLLAYGMLSVGGLLLLFNGIRRLMHRLIAHPLEVEFT
jgi:hypothetical protein